MDITAQIIILSIAIIAAQWTAWRVHVPAIIFLLGAGFMLGPVTGLIKPDILLGDLMKPFVATAVAIILFEGSLQLRFKELRETRRAVRHVIFLGAPIGWILISLAAHYIAGLEWAVAITLGGMLVVTGPTVIMPMLRQARLNPRAGAILKWEGIVNDPIGILFAILSYEYFVSAKNGTVNTAFYIEHGLAIILVGVLSFLLAHVIKRIFERGYIPEYLKTPFILSTVIALFFACDYILHESGLIAVTVLGLTLANIHTSSIEEIKRFKETITIMLVSGVFILLTADLDASVMLNINWQGALFIAALLFVIRPIIFFICSIGTQMTRNEILLTGLIAPRGVVCAAMAGVIGPLLTEAGFEDGNKILPIAFAVVVISVILHSLMIKPLARRLKLTSDETNGVIIAGSYPWSIQLAEALKSRNVPVMIIDNDWSALGKARLADIPVYYGELLSEETEFALEFNIYNTLIAATTNPAYNALVCEKFGYEYGTERMFNVNIAKTDIASRHKIASHVQARPLVSKEFTLDDADQKYADGWRFRTMRIGRPEKDADLIIPPQTENCIHIGVISKTGLISFYTSYAASKITPKEDEYMIVMEKDVQTNI